MLISVDDRIDCYCFRHASLNIAFLSVIGIPLVDAAPCVKQEDDHFVRSVSGALFFCSLNTGAVCAQL